MLLYFNTTLHLLHVSKMLRNVFHLFVKLYKYKLIKMRLFDTIITNSLDYLKSYRDLKNSAVSTTF